MPSYKLVLFSDPVNQSYMIDQEQAIKKAIPQIEIEQATHEDSRLALYTTKAERMPCLMLFKDEARMQTKHARRSHEEIVAWIKSIVGV